MKIKRAYLLISLLYLVSLMMPFFRYDLASAATLEVNTTGDTSDSVPGNGICDDGSGDCSLRAAIEEANNNPGQDTINFDIPGGGLQTIIPLTGYPDITETVTIDATTQTGSSCGTLVPGLPSASNTSHNIMIELRGDSIVSGNGELFKFFGANADNSVVRGFVLNRVISTNNAITVEGIDYVDSISGLVVECNYIGTDQSGTIGYGSGIDGLGIEFRTGVVNSSIRNNLISGGWSIGISALGQNNIHNNLIGVDVTGNVSLANNTGAYISSDTSEKASFSNNVVSGNNQYGLSLVSEASIEGNFIGVSLSGNPAGNGSDGIYVGYQGSGITIGSSSSHNVISANGQNGIHLERSNQCQPPITNLVIIGNYIGTDAAGKNTVGYGNSRSGININERDDGCGGSIYKNRIGGDGPGEQNVIAGNKDDGVRIYSVPWQECDDGEGGTYPCNGTDVFGISLLPNSIFSNGNMGINLATDADNDGEADADLTPNPINDLAIDYPASKANNFINKPTINSAEYDGNNFTVNYSFKAPQIKAATGYELHTDDIAGYRLDFYLSENNTQGAYSGYSQGRYHIGSFIVDGSATNATHEFSNIKDLPAGYVLGTTTVLWKNIPNTADPCTSGFRFGTGPPYELSGGCM